MDHDDNPAVVNHILQWLYRGSPAPGFYGLGLGRFLTMDESVIQPHGRCQNMHCKTPTQNVAKRWCQGIGFDGKKTGATMEVSCEPCYLLDEAEFAERMPRQLAAITMPSAPMKQRDTFADLQSDWDLLPDA